MNYISQSLTKGFGTIVSLFITFMLALLLNILPLPYNLFLLMPNWVALVLIYWIVFVPKLLGIKFALILGIIVDLILGNLVGTTSLCLVPIAFFAEFFCYKFRTFNIWTQFLLIMVLVGLGQLIRLWIQLYIHHPPNSIMYWMSIISSTFVWPVVCAGLHVCNKAIIKFIS